MRRSSLSTVAAGGALALLAGLAPAASAAPAPVDPAQLSALRAVLAASDQAWAATGGSAVSRCSFTLPPELSTAGRMVVRMTIRSAGAHGATEIRASAGSAGAPERVYLQGRKVIRHVPGTEKRALRKHGMAHPPRWATVPRVAPPKTRNPTDYSGDLALRTILAGEVTALTVTDGTYTGRVRDQKVESSFTIRTDGARATDLELGWVDSPDNGCRIQVSYDPQQVRVPKSATGLRARVVYAESQLAGLARGVKRTPHPRASVAALRMMTKVVLNGVRLRSTKIRHGVALTTQVKGWSHPLAWHLTVTKGKVTAFPTRTTR